jgi:Tfp pilus assembly protein PilO
MPVSGQKPMNKLSKEKRNHLILVVLGLIVIVSGLWFGLINWQQDKHKALMVEKEKAQTELVRMEQMIKNADRIESDLEEATRKLAAAEEQMAPPADPFAWMVSTMRLFRLPYKVDVPAIGQPDVKEMNLLPKFPYKQAIFAVGGTACFHDLGKFIADFENHFPHFRIINMDLAPATAAENKTEADREKLQFKIEIVTLMKPGTS